MVKSASIIRTILTFYKMFNRLYHLVIHTGAGSKVRCKDVSSCSIPASSVSVKLRVN